MFLGISKWQRLFVLLIGVWSVGSVILVAVEGRAIVGMTAQRADEQRRYRASFETYPSIGLRYADSATRAKIEEVVSRYGGKLDEPIWESGKQYYDETADFFGLLPPITLEKLEAISHELKGIPGVSSAEPNQIWIIP